MIGIPGQTQDDLVRDIGFFSNVHADMLGMGPYIPQVDARSFVCRPTSTPLTSARTTPPPARSGTGSTGPRASTVRATTGSCSI
jgi:hypothetical protein